jgi:hypothetical protein
MTPVGTLQGGLFAKSGEVPRKGQTYYADLLSVPRSSASNRRHSAAWRKLGMYLWWPIPVQA